MLTPEEIQSREFLVSLRGYDRDEVHAFLGRVAEQLAQTEAKAAQLQQRLERTKDQPPTSAPVEAPARQAAEVSPEPSAMFAEIGKETQRILEAAQEAGQQIQRKARQEADRELQAARAQSAKVIAEGERRREHVERVVSELEQSRAAMSVQLRGVGRTIEQTLRELGSGDGGAGTVREALEAEAAAPPPADEAARALPAEDAPADEAAVEAEAGALDVTPDAAEQDEPAEEQESQPDELQAQEPPAASPDREPSAVSEPPAADVAVTDVVPEEPAVQEEPAAPAPAAAATGETAPAGEVSGGVDTVEPGPVVEDVTAEEASAAVASEPAMEPDSRTGDAASGRSDPQGLRAAALSPLHPKLVRKVKRELQEIQNIALDKVRRSKGEGEVDDFLPDREDTEGLGEGAAEMLQQAWGAGVQSAAVLADRDLGDPGDAPDLAALFSEDAADRVRSGLGATLRMGLSSDEGPQGLTDRIGSVFGELKGAQAEELAATHLIRAYELGLLGAWSAGDVSARRWVLGREPRCPEGKCRNNDQSGAVAVNDPFPSGHDVPPVHVGCTCTTVPEVPDESSG